LNEVATDQVVQEGKRIRVAGNAEGSWQPLFQGTEIPFFQILCLLNIKVFLPLDFFIKEMA
jgi:hypothetical protein